MNFSYSAMFLTVGLVAATAATPTLTFESASPLTAGGTPINLTNHAAPRLVDWDNDGVLDLLVAGGDGYLWIFRQDRPTNSTEFLAGVRVLASGSPIRVGTGYTGAFFGDMDGDGRPDLVIAGNDNRVRYFSNAGTLVSPTFTSSVIIQSNGTPFVLPSGVGGRIEIADWDGDGRLDLITGEFDGYLTWYRNTGTTNLPAFSAAGIRLRLNNSVFQEPYNVHPRVFDFNQDGLPDLAYGINWGYVKTFINTEGLGATNFPANYLFRDTNGLELNIRSLNADDTTPDFADLNGDGVLDLISGGVNGNLFFMAGVSHARSQQQIEAIMAAHTNDLGATLNSNASLRDTLFGLHRGLRSLAIGFLPQSDREALRDWYRDHIVRYSRYLLRQQLHQTNDAYVPYLAGQAWVNLFESVPDSPAHRRFTASACGFTGTHSNLLVDLGILYIENSRSTAASRQALYDIAASVPAPLQIVERITHDDFLRPPSGTGINIEARTGVNLFAQVGDYTEGFPADVPQTLIDGFSVVVAHELNHNVENAAGRLYPWFWDRKFDLLEQAAPPHLIFRDHNTAGFGLDLPATQSNFLTRGYWNGVPANWTAAYDAYWATGPGAGFDRHWLRDNLKFCLDAPQEAFATLANQYFTSSEVMLQLALARWQQGITNCINQLLFFADVYSLGSNHTFFYRINPAAQVTRAVVPLQRDSRNHICGLTTTNTHYDFLLDAEGNVLDYRQTAATTPMPSLSISRPSPTSIRLSIPGNPPYKLVTESSTNLSNWTSWWTNNPFTGAFSVTNPITQPSRFHRLRRDW